MEINWTPRASLGYDFLVADLFHVGQLRHLRMAKKLCDTLSVGVLTDEATASYKEEVMNHG